MKIIALGTGSAFTMKGHQTNYIIQHNGKNLLVDCGTDIRWSLQAHGFKFSDIDAVYISHAHADHIGGLEFLGYTRYFTKEYQTKTAFSNPLPLPKLFCKREMIAPLWEKSLSGGMSCIDGVDRNIDTYFDVVPVDEYFVWEDMRFDLSKSEHISGKYTKMDSYGLDIHDVNHKRVYITTDARFPEYPENDGSYEADVIIHDCETMYSSGVHSHYDQLKTLPDHIKKRIVLIHYQDNVFEDFAGWNAKAKADGFKGFAEPGVIYETDVDFIINKVKIAIDALKENAAWIKSNILEKIKSSNINISTDGLEEKFVQAIKVGTELEANILKSANGALSLIEKAIKEHEFAEHLKEKVPESEAKTFYNLCSQMIDEGERLVKESQSVKKAYNIYTQGISDLKSVIEGKKK